MFAIIEVGAKQFNVGKDDIIEVNKMDIKDGKDFAIDKVILYSDDKKLEVGKPYLKNVAVKAEVLGQIKGEKTESFKYRRRKSSHWQKGHREKLTRIKIKSIEVGS
jgi:large subunit ribosomal protein L21